MQRMWKRAQKFIHIIVDNVPAGMCCASHKINNHGTNLTGIAYTSLLANVFNYGRF